MLKTSFLIGISEYPLIPKLVVFINSPALLIVFGHNQSAFFTFLYFLVKVNILLTVLFIIKILVAPSFRTPAIAASDAPPAPIMTTGFSGFHFFAFSRPTLKP